MHRQPKSPLKVKENESGCLEEKNEAPFPLPKDQQICKGIKFRASRASKKENFSSGSQEWSPKRALKSPRGLGEELSHPEGDPGGCHFPGGSCGALQGDVGTEPPWPLPREGNFPGSRSGSLGDDPYTTPERDRAEGKPHFGISEERSGKPVDFATVTITEFGIAPESFTKGCKGNSPGSLKFRRRSTIGLRGSPENNSLILYLAQQRSKRQKEAFTQISPFKHANVRSLKDRIETFQTSFESLQEAEEETGFFGEDSQQGGSSQNEVPLKEEPNVEQWSEKFPLGNSGAALEENCRENVTRSNESDPSILSPNPAGTEPAAPKECVYGQKYPPESLETVAVGATLERGCVFRSADPRSAVPSDVSRRKVGFVEGVSEASRALVTLVTPPATPQQTAPSGALSQSGSLRPILKKTPGRQLLDSPKEHLNDAVDRGGGESVPVSYYEKTLEASETAQNAPSLDSRTPKKKKVTFGEVLSPEIFDQSLPANTPLHRGASPGPAPSSSPAPRPGLTSEPFPRLDFGCDDECVEAPPQNFPEAPFAAEDPPPVENAEAPTDKPDMVKTRSSAKRKLGAESEEAHGSPWGAESTRNAEDTKNPRKNKIQRLKNPSSSAPRKTQRPRPTSYGKRKKRKVKKSLYGEREMASKKPLLSPIPEIPEVFFSVSSPASPNGLFTEEAVADNPKSWNAGQDIQEKAALEGMRGKSIICALDVCPSSKDLDVAAPGSSRDGTFGVSQSELEPASGPAQEFSNIVPDAEGGFDTPEHFQQGEEAAYENEAKESSSLIENEQLQGNLLEFLEQQATDVHEGAQRTQCPQAGSVSGSPARRGRRRSSSAIYFPPVEETLEITGIDLPVSSYDVEEVFSVPRGSFQPCPRRNSSSSAELRVRRSMRLSKAAGSQGLAWIQLPSDIPQPALAPRARRRVSTSILTGSENLQPREQKPRLSSALGKENEGSAPCAHGPCRGRRSVPAPPETPWAQTQQRRITNPVNKDRNNPKHSEEAEVPLEVTLGEVSALSDFLK